MWHFLCSKLYKVFSLPSDFYKMFFHSTDTLYVMLPYRTAPDKVNEFLFLGRFMLVPGVVLCESKVVFGCSRWLGTPHRMTPNQTQAIGHEKRPTYMHFGTPSQSQIFVRFALRPAVFEILHILGFYHWFISLLKFQSATIGF